ncbi:MAG: hypothetical protein ACREMO_01200 [Gemmatimonadales bacterium]
MGPSGVLNAPGTGWVKLAQAAAAQLPEGEIDGVWVFRAIRQDNREWGTALLSRRDGERRRIYTARYVHTIKGKERGRFESVLEEVGSGPVEALAELLAGVRRRIDDEIPTPVPPDSWFPPPSPAPADDPTHQG